MEPLNLPVLVAVVHPPDAEFYRIFRGNLFPLEGFSLVNNLSYLAALR